MTLRNVALALGFLATLATSALAQEEECRELTILDAPDLLRIDIDPLTAANRKGVKFKGAAILVLGDGSTLPLQVTRKLKKKKGTWKYKLKTSKRTKPKAKVVATIGDDHETILKIKLTFKRKGEKTYKLKDPPRFRLGPCPPPGVREVHAGAKVIFQGVAEGFMRFMDLVPTVLDPDAAAAAGITFEPDTTPGAPPHSYVYVIPWDSDGNGEPDETIEGRGEFSGDPQNMGPGFSGTLDYEERDGLLMSGDVTLDFVVLDGGWELSGEADMTLNGTDYGVDVTFPEEDPLTVMTPTDNDANLCDADVDGPVEVEIRTPTFTYFAIWEFIPGLKDMLITSQLFTPPQAPPEPLPDSSDRLPPCYVGELSDWEGTWLLNWSCDGGAESGASRLTFRVTGDDTLEIRDEHPIGSGNLLVYTATADPGDPYTLRGFFRETDDFGTYREDFVYTLRDGGEYWLQNNTYEYEETGFRGTCGGSGHPE